MNYGDMFLLEHEPEEVRGIYIDIFPLDDAPDNAAIRFLHGAACLTIQLIASCVNVRDSVRWLRNNGVKIMGKEWLQVGPKLFFGALFGVLPVSEWTRKYDRLTARYHNRNAKYLTCYAAYKNLKKSVFSRAMLFPCRDGLFEGRVWKLPHHSDAYLKRIYGAYTILPDPEQQKIHPVFELEFPKNHSG